MVKKLIFLSLVLLFVAFIYWRLFINLEELPVISPFITPPSLAPVLPASAQSDQNLVNLIAVGDIMLGRNVNQKMIKYKNFKYPFEKTASFLAAADITFGNLESPFVKNCPIIGTGSFTFCADFQALEGLLFAGFDVLSLENNHILNFGKAGLDQTKTLLTENQILLSTAGELVIKKIKDLSFGFLSFTYDKNLGRALTSVKTKKDEVDILVVSLHWGNEYQKEPPKSQKELAHKLIEAGAKIIIGHHPHVTQPVEKYQEGLIFYSLGNFVFDQMWSQETRKGLVAKITFKGDNIKDFQTYQVLISDYCQPDFSTTP
jgi:poly-gamma-glutamate synthesis protein (capsule biosynthesis protein)